MPYPKLKNPPIVEAVIDFRFIDGANISLEEIKEFEKINQSNFLESVDILKVNMMGKFDLKDADQTTFQKMLEGVRFQNRENNILALITETGITISKINNYEDWEVFSSQAKEILDLLVAFKKEIKVQRTGMRYRNNFPLAFRDNQINNNLNLYPIFPANIATGVQTFSVSLSLVNDKISSFSNVTIALQPAQNNEFGIVLDIDVYKLVDMSIGDASDLNATYSELREYKNEIFNSVLTEETLKIFM